MTERAKKAGAEVEKLMSRIDRINNDNFNLANALSKAEAEVERLKAILHTYRIPS